MSHYARLVLLSCECDSLKKDEILPYDYCPLTASYNNIGNVYCNMGEYSKALSSYERSLGIAVPLNHPDLVLGTAYTLKKISTLRNPDKKFCRFQISSK